MAIQYNPLLPEVRPDPYPHYHQLRSEDPVQWTEAPAWRETITLRGLTSLPVIFSRAER